MSVKIHLKTGEYICSSCSAEVDENSKSCPECGEDFEGMIEEESLFVIPKEEVGKDETGEVVRIFKMLTGSSILDVGYLQNLKRDMDNIDLPSRVKNILAVIEYYGIKYHEVNDEIESLLTRMKKEKKDEILSDLDRVKELEEKRRGALFRLVEINNKYGEFLDNYWKFLQKKEAMLKARIDEFQKEVERRKLQAKMLVEKEKELLEREHRLREREKQLERELAHIEESSRKLESEEISREEWMEQQRKIQEKLYKLREEVIKRSQESEKEKLTKQVLQILDDLLGKLPDEVIEEFAMSKDFELYKKVMEMYGLGGGSGSS